MADLAHPLVLIAEDDVGVRDLLDIRLSLAGYRVKLAKNGREAVEHLTLRPDALILDINMPLLDGFGVLEWMARHDAIRRCAVMMLTARHVRDDVERCVKLGAKDYLAKPFTDAVLLARVARLLRSPRRPPRSMVDDDVVLL